MKHLIKGKTAQMWAHTLINLSFDSETGVASLCCQELTGQGCPSTLGLYIHVEGLLKELGIPTCYSGIFMGIFADLRPSYTTLKKVQCSNESWGRKIWNIYSTSNLGNLEFAIQDRVRLFTKVIQYTWDHYQKDPNKITKEIVSKM